MDDDKIEEVIGEDGENRKARSIYDFIEVIVQALVMIFILFTFFFRVAGVNGESMVPTLQDKNWLLVTNFNFKPQHGDIVVLVKPTVYNEPLIKRVIALGGETVDINAQGKVTVNGKALEEAYIAELVDNAHRGDVVFPHTVPQGKVFVMGDNRNKSADSRYSYVGDIDENYIVGKAGVRLLPFGHFKID